MANKLPIETAMEDHKALLVRNHQLEQEVKAGLEREAILKGRIEQLDSDLVDTRARADHYLRWNVEITRQLHNIGNFVSDAMNLAKMEVENQPSKGNHGGEAAIGRALGMETGDVNIQREVKR